MRRRGFLGSITRKGSSLEGKGIALCVCGSISAVLMPQLARELKRHGAEVTAFMSREARRILHPNAMEFATEGKVVTRFTGGMDYLKDFDLILLCPATANTVAKMAAGISDSPITALFLASRARVIVAPAMHGRMWSNSTVKRNVKELKRRGCGFVDPVLEEGKAKLAPPLEVVDRCISALHTKELEGEKVLITAGPTLEHLDPIRILTNTSSGKMGLCLAREAFFRGAEVRLIYGPGNEEVPRYLKTSRVRTTGEMLAAFKKEVKGCGIVIAAAAVADFKPKGNERKIRSGSKLNIELVPTPKIIGEVKGRDVFKVGFRALYGVTEKELELGALELMERHGLDLVVANDVSKGIFGSDETEGLILDKKKKVTKVPRTSKEEAAGLIFDEIGKRLQA